MQNQHIVHFEQIPIFAVFTKYQFFRIVCFSFRSDKRWTNMMTTKNIRTKNKYEKLLLLVIFIVIDSHLLHVVQQQKFKLNFLWLHLTWLDSAKKNIYLYITAYNRDVTRTIHHRMCFNYFSTPLNANYEVKENYCKILYTIIHILYGAIKIDIEKWKTMHKSFAGWIGFIITW